MAKGKTADSYRSREELDHAVRALCEHFGTRAVVIIGSQAILGHWPNAPHHMRRSLEFDIYPANAEEWEALHPGQEASEEVEALFGYESDFHRAFGFYVDGVDSTTARLPPGWRNRKAVIPVTGDAGECFAIVPSIADLVVSKLCRLDPKDSDWIVACHAEAPLDIVDLRRLLDTVEIQPEIRRRAEDFLDRLKNAQSRT